MERLLLRPLRGRHRHHSVSRYTTCTETITGVDFRNVAIVAHVDHGKTTLVDAMLRQSGALTHRGDDTIERLHGLG